MPQEAIVSSYFTLTIDGALSAYFQSVTGMGSENAIVTDTARGPDGKQITTKTIGTLKWNDVTLKRGISRDADTSMQMWKWRKLVEQGKIDEARKNGSIQMFNSDMQVVARWDLINCWPAKLTGPAPDANKNEAAIEELVVTHEGYERVQ
jgi:phage tail-like protein